MSHQIVATDQNAKGHHLEIDRLHPDHCPACHQNMQPTFVESFLNGVRLKSTWLQRVYRCANHRCGVVFLANYKQVKQSSGSHNYYFYKHCSPGSPIPPQVPDLVAKVSRSFAEIYKQASEAEHHGLTDICGGGYRKSLEFLVKDYLISISDQIGKSEKQIKNKSLGNCIEDHIDDVKTKQIAKRAAWLGNDETHYLRKWEDKELKDLKVLLHLTMNAIENALLADEYIEQMNPDADQSV